MRPLRNRWVSIAVGLSLAGCRSVALTSACDTPDEIEHAGWIRVVLAGTGASLQLPAAWTAPLTRGGWALRPQAPGFPRTLEVRAPVSRRGIYGPLDSTHVPALASPQNCIDDCVTVEALSSCQRLVGGVPAEIETGLLSGGRGAMQRVPAVLVRWRRAHGWFIVYGEADSPADQARILAVAHTVRFPQPVDSIP
jgi:hypothetical protein